MIESSAQGTTTLHTVPRHVAIIMDGNGRWAKSRGLARSLGHLAGTDNLYEILRAAREFGIEVLTLYAFSTENWDRPEQEVRALLRLIERSIDRNLDELNDSGVQFRHIGNRERLEPRLLTKIDNAVNATQANHELILNIAFNYGGRAEILNAVRAAIHDGLLPEQINEETFSSYLDTAGLPDPDLIIRTAGEMRLSNFLIWQAAYAEMYSTPVFWPDFDRQELYKALVEYQSRERRFGKVTEGTI